MTPRLQPLPVECLRWRCDPSGLGFETTAEVPPLETTVGQERGADAISLALAVQSEGYNVYVAGATGTGRTTTVRHEVGRTAAARPPADDWCYLHNFADPARPVAVRLPAGRAPHLAADLDALIAGCRREIPRVFRGEEYTERRNELIRQTQSQRERHFDEMRKEAEAEEFNLRVDPNGVLTVPILDDGKPATAERFAQLSDERRAELREKAQRLDRMIESHLEAVQRLDRALSEQLATLDRDTLLATVGHLLEALRIGYAAVPPVLEHLDAIQEDLLKRIDDVRAPEHAEQSGGAEEQAGLPAVLMPPSSPHDRYRANVFVTHTPTNGAPFVFEPNPTYYNLIGRIDYRATLGAMTTDFTLIRPGALHRANGGFLVLEARDVLLNPFAWEALKRALRDGEVRTENLGEQYSAFPTATLKPQPVPLGVKVLLIGDLSTYMLLYHLDDDFRKLFKIKAHFGPEIERTPGNERAYAAFVSAQVRAHRLPPFRAEAVAGVLERAARLAEHQERLSTAFSDLAEVVVEAAHWARAEGASMVGAPHVRRALAEQERRLNLAEEEMRRLLRERTIVVATSGLAVGQVNGLSILNLGDYSFAHPSRITARTGMGSEGVVNVEREAKLSGPTHSKGVLTLTGYLIGAYAQERPLAVSARLAFEQVYSGIDGDSASSAELYALLSSLSGIPIRQSIAVTGSVNQHGVVQAIGGVTQKVEGFFAACAQDGLTGEQGVLIPEANVPHLMLKDEVVDAVARGQFHVWAVRTIDEGIELLTGVPAGERLPDGTYPEDTVHGCVQRRLTSLATRLAEFADRRTTALVPAHAGTTNGAGSNGSTENLL
ncbi:MAG TPA: AAA family ATPase [Chloroflexota bacterium]|nr:AAA family ATPase [Chloroflexota bacterium]